MIYHYSAKIRGALHVQENTVCQDACRIVVQDASLAIGAVADGLGSANHSDVASEEAVRVAVTYCNERLGRDSNPTHILNTIKASFHLAQDAIENIAEQQDYELSDCDTTLSLCVLLDGNLYYGQSGDSGIIALSENGFYSNITTQQRDDMGRVYPLYRREEKWVFRQAEGRFAAVVLATDGVYETFFPIYIRKNPPGAILAGEEGIHIALLHYFMEKDQLQLGLPGEADAIGERRKYLENIPPKTIDDDKTILVIIDDSIPVVRQVDDYYREPDWAGLRKEWRENYRRLAYPNLCEVSPDDKPVGGITQQGETV